jgi:DNA repair exonuclease SbcCD ATPase subunit
MKTVILKSILLENYKSFSSSLPGRKDFSCEFGKRTKISGRNREGKSTVKDAFFDVLTSKLADGSQPDAKVRPHTKDGIDIDRVDIIRDLELEIDGKPVTVTKKTAQKWRKPRGQSEAVFDGNITTYTIDGFEAKQKDYQKWQESIADPDILLMCSNARPFLNMVQKSTAEARKLLEWISGFKIEDFVTQNPEYTHIENITKGHAIEDVLKQLRKNLTAQKKVAETVRTQLTYEKNRGAFGEIEISDLELAIADLNHQIEELDKQEVILDEAIKSYDEKSKNVLDLKFEQSEIVRKANEGIVAQRKEIEGDIFSLKQEKKSAENDLRMAEMDLKHATMAIERHETELTRMQEDYSRLSVYEFDDSEIKIIEGEIFDENSLICPTCGQKLPEEQAEKIRAEFEEKKKLRIEGIKSTKQNAYEIRDKELENVIVAGNRASTNLNGAKETKEESEQKISNCKKAIADFAMQIQTESKKLSEIPESVDLSDNVEYQKVTAEIGMAEEALKQMNNGSEERFILRNKRNGLLNEISDKKSLIKKQISDEVEKECRVSELEEKLKAENQRVADIEKDIDTLKNFSIKKNEALAAAVNPHFRHFQFNFLEFTQEGNPVETLRLMVEGTDYFSGLNGGDQRLVELDLCRGLQEINNLCLPIWLDESNTIDPERIPQDLEQQLICLERADCSLKVEVME